jgi:hypothetical protein
MLATYEQHLELKWSAQLHLDVFGNAGNPREILLIMTATTGAFEKEDAF